MWTPEIEQVARSIAAYWVKYPKAGDSARGIEEAWLRGGASHEQVLEALEQMHQLGWVEKPGGFGGQGAYRLAENGLTNMHNLLSRKT